VHSDVDRCALHVELADEAVALGGKTPAESYLRGDVVVDAARRTGADAIHPGYSFLSERADFARACAGAGLVFVGPSPEAIAAMGDKLAAKRLMHEAGVPVLPGEQVPDGPLDPADLAVTRFPVIVKAALGGGGKGMRVVTDPQDLGEAVAAARREAQAAFGDATVFIEPYLERPRHIEVQIVGDRHGTVLHLGERECSIQRRHQKVIEESPSPMVDRDLREQLGAAAVAAAAAIGYRNAGTVEFIATEDGEFHFLEVNTRLQVEHPVTELAWTLGGEPLDLVRLQLLIAAGEPLGFTQADLRQVGHAVEARLYAEDPGADFLPAAGTLEIFEPAGTSGVRVDTGVRSGDTVSIHYDPLLAKVIAAAPTRFEAVARLARELELSRFHGITTNRDFLLACLRHPAFVAGDLHTGFIDAHLPPDTRSLAREPGARALHAAAAALAGARERHLQTPVLRSLPPGWRNNPAEQHVDLHDGTTLLAVRYARARDGRWRVRVAEESLDVEVLGWADEREDGRHVLGVDGRRLPVRAARVGATWHLASPLGQDTLVEQPRFPRPEVGVVTGGLTAPMPGTILDVRVEQGATVHAGAVLVVVEAMKMEHRITAPHDGTVAEVRVAPGDGVEAGEVLLVVAQR
jgi:acetyl/propionyl-CoA carboxylase alpha subunit